MTSVGQMIKRISGLHCNEDVNEWEEEFIKNIVEKTDNGNRTTHLTPKQVAKIEHIHTKHFA